MLLHESSRGCSEGDDQIGRSLSVERPEIFNKFGLSSDVAIESRDQRLFLDVQRPGRLLVQFSLYLSAPRGTLLEIRPERMKKENVFRLISSHVRFGLRDSFAH